MLFTKVCDFGGCQGAYSSNDCVWYKHSSSLRQGKGHMENKSQYHRAVLQRPLSEVSLEQILADKATVIVVCALQSPCSCEGASLFRGYFLFTKMR